MFILSFIQGMQAEVDDVEVNQDHVDQLIQDALGDLGTVEGEVDGDIQIKVEKGNCLSQIGEALGIDWHEIAEYNGIEDPYTIYLRMKGCLELNTMQSLPLKNGEE